MTQTIPPAQRRKTPKNQAPKPHSRPKGSRLIQVGTTQWWWLVGRGGNVVARSETGEKRTAHAAVVKGITPDTFERGQYKHTSDGMVTPKEIAAWLA